MQVLAQIELKPAIMSDERSNVNTEKNVLADILAIVTKNETLIVGALVSLIVFLAAKLNIIIDSASLGVILTPFVTTILVELDKKAGVAAKVKLILPPWKTKKASTKVDCPTSAIGATGPAGPTGVLKKAVIVPADVEADPK